MCLGTGYDLAALYKHIFISVLSLSKSVLGAFRQKHSLNCQKVSSWGEVNIGRVAGDAVREVGKVHVIQGPNLEFIFYFECHGRHWSISIHGGDTAWEAGISWSSSHQPTSSAMEVTIYRVLRTYLIFFF